MNGNAVFLFVLESADDGGVLGELQSRTGWLFEGATFLLAAVLHFTGSASGSQYGERIGHDPIRHLCAFFGDTDCGYFTLNVCTRATLFTFIRVPPLATTSALPLRGVRCLTSWPTSSAQAAVAFERYPFTSLCSAASPSFLFSSSGGELWKARFPSILDTETRASVGIDKIKKAREELTRRKAMCP